MHVLFFSPLSSHSRICFLPSISQSREVEGEQDQEGEQRKGAISAVTRATDPLPPSIYPSDQGPPPESKGVSLLQLKLRPWLQITAKAAVKGR